MNYYVILNGCSSDYYIQAEEMKDFIHDNIDAEAEGKSIIFYNEENKKEAIDNSPTKDICLIKIERYQPENILEILCQLTSQEEADLFLFGSNFAGNELAVRFGYRVSGSSLVGVNKVNLRKRELMCYKPVYSNHIEGEFVLNKKPYCISIAKGYASKTYKKIISKNIVKEIDMTQLRKDSFVKTYEILCQEAEVNELENAKFVVIIGQGARNKQGVKEIEEIAKKLGAQIGITRPVAMNAWAPIDKLVGISGMIIKPKLCIAAGVSGAAALMAGIEKSEYIIAINIDEKAPIIKNSDVAVIDDCFEVLEQLLRIVQLDHS
ncbi:electron transfer flavoprotein subunit alpha/FixB family protein [Tepidanaerobacter syntrophicus]|uniref:electron transfer flavoprotein subunit alpha/FixB family protein n=1 Tax=Tepidanaerobacter syntrophicus TaxID=224999 RepID=UPI001BD48A7F|nr:electron transfer flavoprotein subunit alpha/FixB family protein [Tepidanaerobacter syntrophicus]